MQPFLTFYVERMMSIIFLKPVAEELKHLAPASIGSNLLC